MGYICNEYINRYYPDFNYKVFLSAHHEGAVDNCLGLDTIGLNDYDIPCQETILIINISSKTSLTLNTLKLLDYSRRQGINLLCLFLWYPNILYAGRWD